MMWFDHSFCTDSLSFLQTSFYILILKLPFFQVQMAPSRREENCHERVQRDFMKSVYDQYSSHISSEFWTVCPRLCLWYVEHLSHSVKQFEKCSQYVKLMSSSRWRQLDMLRAFENTQISIACHASRQCMLECFWCDSKPRRIISCVNLDHMSGCFVEKIPLKRKIWIYFHNYFM